VHSWGYYCEHVLFQECFREHPGDNTVRIVIDPRLVFPGDVAGTSN